MDKHILSDDMPCWYEIGWQATPKPAILIRVREELFTSEVNLKHLPRMMDEAAKELKTTFVCDLEKAVGYDKFRIKRVGSTDGFARFEFRIPDLRTDPQLCFSCGGTGKDAIFTGETCRTCHGRKRRRGLSWSQGKLAIRTLNSFLSSLYLCDCSIGSSSIQLLTLDLYYRDDINVHQCPLSVEASKYFIKWLRTLPEGPLTSCMEAMRIAHETMIGKSMSSPREFRARVSDGRFNMSVPGNCACFGTEPERFDPEYGARYGSHNVDAPWQQLSLVAGISALHDMARQAGK